MTALSSADNKYIKVQIIRINNLMFCNTRQQTI